MRRLCISLTDRVGGSNASSSVPVRSGDEIFIEVRVEGQRSLYGLMEEMNYIKAQMKHYLRFLSNNASFIVCLFFFTSCAVFNESKKNNAFCTSLNYFLEQDARLKLLERDDSGRVHFYTNHYKYLNCFIDRNLDAICVLNRHQLPNDGNDSYQLLLSTLNISNIGDGVHLTFLHLGDGNSFEIIIQIEDKYPRILDVKEFQFDKSKLE